jgi:dihydroxyacetone kinase
LSAFQRAKRSETLTSRRWRHELPQADDPAIGDADHGINMARGMTAVINKLDDNHQAHANDAVTGFDTVTKPVAVSAALQKES